MVTATQGGSSWSGGAATVSLVVGRMSIDVAFSPTAVQPGDSFTATYTLSNLDGAEDAVVILTDTIGASFPGATLSNLQVPPCSATSTLSESGGTLNFFEPALAAASSCSFTVDLTLPADFEPGDYSHTVADATGSYPSGVFQSMSGTAVLQVVMPLDWRGDFVRAAHPTQVAPLEIVIRNSSDDDATDLAFTLDLDGVSPGLAAEGLPTADACGSGSTLSGTGVLSLSAGALLAGESCTLSMDVRVPSGVVGPAGLELTSTALTVTMAGGTETAPPLTLVLVVPQPCRPGYAPADADCVDIDECTEGSDQCDPVASCTNDVGDYSCACPTGYTGDGFVCTDIDECLDLTDDCAVDGGVCTNTSGSFSCACDLGWLGDGTVCDEDCGDGMIVGEEACDDAGVDVGDGCDDACAIEAGFACVGEPSVCEETCGDGVISAGEDCDDGNLENGDGCDDICAVEPGFACSGEPSVCEETCGNGTLDAGEQCDDGNLDLGDGCDDTCQAEAEVCPDSDCEGTGCSCSSGSGSVSWMVLGLLPLLRRRRAGNLPE